MKFTFSDKHSLHAPPFEVMFGERIPMFERPERAEELRRAVLAEGHEQMPAQEFGTEIIESIHDPGLVRHLEGLWREWSQRYPDTVVVPDTMLLPAILDGIGPPREPADVEARLGYWCFDTTTALTEGTYEAARAAVDVACTAVAIAMSDGRASYALCRPPGHHAPRAAYGGYCFFNNAAVATQHAIDQGCDRVAIVDVDYHHGNGTQQIFYERGDVFYASLHGSPERAYPYFTGWAEETGAGSGHNANLNVPLPEGVTDDAYLQELERVAGAVGDFTPDLLVVSLGLDVLAGDPISDFMLTTAGLERMGELLAQLDLPTAVVQEGGYLLGAIGPAAAAFLRGIENQE